jgi:hypothetical protein
VFEIVTQRRNEQRQRVNFLQLALAQRVVAQEEPAGVHDGERVPEVVCVLRCVCADVHASAAGLLQRTLVSRVHARNGLAL